MNEWKEKKSGQHAETRGRLVGLTSGLQRGRGAATGENDNTSNEHVGNLIHKGALCVACVQ